MHEPRLDAVIAEQRYPLVFVTISGAHLYGFPSPDSDYDLRGAHLLPLRELVGLDTGPATIEYTGDRDGLEIDLVSHELHKFCGLLLRNNGYVLEQLFSPLVLHTSPAHAELRAIARGCITRHHSHHYLGFADTQWRLFERERPRRVKPLLYTFRVLLTGIHLMQTGQVEANLVRLNEHFQLPYLGDLVARKLAGPEHGAVEATAIEPFAREVTRLRAELEAAALHSALPERPTARPALHDLLLRLRLSERS